MKAARENVGEGSRCLRASAALFLGGVLLSLVAGLFHPGHADPNDHPAAFAEYAADDTWTLVHLGQFVGMAVLLCGLIVLFVAQGRREEGAGWLPRIGVVAAVVALALYAVLQAVDGVALKQAVDAWAAAPDADRATRFASAESMRWLEWAVRSYQSYLLAAAFGLFGVHLAWTGWLSRGLGYLLALSGLTYAAQGWILGTSGFSGTNSIPTLVGIVLTVLTAVYFLITAWRTPIRTPRGA